MATTTQSKRKLPLAPRRPLAEGDVTFEAFLELIPDGVKADLLNGVIYMASPDNVDANDLNAWLTAVLLPFAEARDLGKFNISRFAYRIGDKGGPEPDLGFVCKARLGLRRRGYFLGAPDLAIEIVSPDSVDRDYVVKRLIYEEAGVREYWILDPDQRRATFLRLKRGRYVEVKPSRRIFKSEVLPGLELDVRWLTTSQRPLSHEVVQRLLSV